MHESIPLHGNLVRLEPIRPEHRAGLLAAATEDRTSFRYTYVPADQDAVDRFIDRALLDRSSGLAATYTVRRAGDGRIAGSTRLRELEYWRAGVWPPRPGHVNPDGVPDAGSIGSTWLAPWAQRTGINTESKLLLLTLAFDTWRVHRISLQADRRNLRSRTAIEGLGATFEGVRRAHFLGADGNPRDSAQYSILRTDWPAVAERLRRRAGGGAVREGGAARAG
ncbi:GNAT family N-acetyltransferase [Streptomyces sp. NPDC059917]|uniref:GNAT family N-acetyltransferase n=1 Tax=Streptomyces sp. NPDC059917 TaxID=3347002 RepID=UPI003666884D